MLRKIRLFGISALVLLATLTTVVHAQETLPLEIGEVLFTSSANGNRDIFLMKPDGTGLRALTDSDDDDYSPIWSPDGQAILFISERDGNADVFTMNTDGSAVRNVTQSALDEFSADWSPDGTQIVFARADSALSPADGGTTQLWVRSLTTDAETQITEIEAFNNEPAWSSQGDRIAFVSDFEGTPQIYSLPPSGGEPTLMTTLAGTTSFNPAWSPNGRWLAFDSVVDGNRDIYVMRADGSEPRRLTDDPAVDMQPVWTFDGLRLMFSSDRTGVMQIYRMDAGGRGVLRLTNSRTAETEAACLWADPNSAP